ncbi:hypothetical protein [Streptomyces sp. NPDC059816]
MNDRSSPRRTRAGTSRKSAPDRRAEILEGGLAVFGALGFDE